MNYEQKHPILQKLEEYFKNTPKEQIYKDWSDILKDTDSEAYYEQKYKEALERAMKLQETCDNTAVVGWCEYILPELKESEDERVRKDLIEYLKVDMEYNPSQNESFYKKSIAWLEKQKEPEDKGEISDGYHTFNELYQYRMLYNAAFFNLLPKQLVHKSKRHHDGEECFGGGWFIVMANLPTGQISNHYELKDWDLFQIPEKEIADEWDGHTPQEAAERLHKYLLEKQGEQPTDKVEPKFKVGDWITTTDEEGNVTTEKIIEFRGDKVRLIDINGFYTLWPKHELNYYHLWTINDAKDGDVLAFKNNISGTIICKFPTNYDTRSYCRFIRNDFIDKEESGWDSILLIPATKEQRDLLFQKMKEAGYEWDADKKELKKMKVASKESENERIKQEILELVSIAGNGSQFEEIKDWLEKQEQIFEQGYAAGAKLADKHPHWISVKVRKPKLKHSEDNMKYSDTVIVTNGKYRTSARWLHNTWAGWYGWYDDGDEELKGITHWMPLPQKPVLSNSSNIGKDLKGGEG